MVWREGLVARLRRFSVRDVFVFLFRARLREGVEFVVGFE